MLQWLPQSLIVFLMKHLFCGKRIAIRVGHAEHAHRELRLLAQGFRVLNVAARIPTPAMDQLLEYLTPNAI